MLNRKLSFIIILLLLTSCSQSYIQVIKYGSKKPPHYKGAKKDRVRSYTAKREPGVTFSREVFETRDKYENIVSYYKTKKLCRNKWSK